MALLVGLANFQVTDLVLNFAKFVFHFLNGTLYDCLEFLNLCA